MNKQVQTEEVYLKSVDNFIKRFEDEYGTFWYAYKELCDILLITNWIRKDIFNNWLNEYDKAEFTLENGKWELFINTNAVSKMINRNNERAIIILKDIINNEAKGDNYQLTDLDKELKKIANEINKPGLTNYVDICESINKVTQMDEYKETRVKYDKEYNLEKEELIDNIRKDIYMYDDIDAVNCIFEMKKKPESDNLETREILYRKHKENGSKSTCPSWLKDVIR